MKDIYKYLAAQGLDPGLRGFRYLGYVIRYAIDNPDARLSDCYEHTASVLSSSSGRVQGDIHYALAASGTAGGRKPRQFINNAVLALQKDF